MGIKLPKREPSGEFLEFNDGDDVIFAIEEVKEWEGEKEADYTVTLVSRVISGPHLDKLHNWRIKMLTAKGGINPEYMMMSKTFFTQEELESEAGGDPLKLVGTTYGVKIGSRMWNEKRYQTFTNVKNLGPISVEQAFGD